MTTAVHRYRRHVACAVFVMTALLAVDPPAATAASAAVADDATVGTIAAQTGSEEGRRSNPSAAIAGFALLAGWLLLGYSLFRQGRRRLARMADDGDPPRQGDHETTPQEPTEQHDEPPESPTDPPHGDEPSDAPGQG